jgi:hypothetical protein
MVRVLVKPIKTTLLLGIASFTIVSAIQAQPPAALDPNAPPTLNPAEYPYADSTDSIAAAPGQHTLLYEDEHVRLLEVTYKPHQLGDAFHGHPFSSVFAFPSARPKGKDTRMDPQASGPAFAEGGPPPGMEYPKCRAMGPQFPHRPENLGDFPDHFYRIEFKRIDGEAFAEHWSEWYPYMKRPMTLDEWLNESGKRPFGQARVTTHPEASKTQSTLNPAGFSYPDANDSINSAPRQHYLRFENASIRFIEVMYRPGERGDAMHGHAYPSVFAFDSPFPSGMTDETLEKTTPNLQAQIGIGGPPPGLRYPLCWTMGAQTPHRPFNHNVVPVHFYRLEFKRLDGEGIKTHWHEWYPAALQR